MPLVNHANREIHLKIVYYGPGLGGKTTNLEQLHARSDPSRRGKLISLVGETERTLFFDLLPIELGTLKRYNIRLHLCTVPGQIARDQTRQLILRNVDGVVFVVDSQKQRLDANINSVQNLETNLRRQGDDPDIMPLVVQYNKRDLPGIMTIEDLAWELRIPDNVVQVQASAIEGWGIFETLKQITKGCLTLINNPAELPEGRSPSVLPGRRASMYRGGPGSVFPAKQIHIPGAPRMPTFKDKV